MKTDTSHPPRLALSPPERQTSPATSPVSSPVPTASPTASPTHSESPPPGSPRSKKIFRAPIAKPSPAEDALVRCIHAKVGGPSKLSTYDDPADVRNVVIEALATEQTSLADTTRIRRGQLTVFERRVVRTVTNRGAAVRSRMRQRREVAHLRAQLRLRDARILQLDAAVHALCAAYSVPVAAAMHGRPSASLTLTHPGSASSPAVHAAAVAAVAAASSTIGSHPNHHISTNAAESVATAAASAAATTGPHPSLQPPPPPPPPPPTHHQQPQPLPPPSVIASGARAGVGGSHGGSSAQMSYAGSSGADESGVSGSQAMGKGHGGAGGKDGGLEVAEAGSGDMGFPPPDFVDSFVHEMMAQQPAWALK